MIDSTHLYSLQKLEQTIGFGFQNLEYLQRAVTHRSFGPEHNERLEYLGDSILGMIIAKKLFDIFQSNFFLCTCKIPPLFRNHSFGIPGGIKIPIFPTDQSAVPHMILSKSHTGDVPAGNPCLFTEHIERQKKPPQIAVPYSSGP